MVQSHGSGRSQQRNGRTVDLWPALVVVQTPRAKETSHQSSPRARTAAPARAAKRQASTGENSLEILEAAQHLLAHHGESGLSIRELCSRAGVTAPTVYHHFGDKQSLVDRIVDDTFAAFDRALVQKSPPKDPVDALHWGFDRYLEYGRTHPTHYRLMFGGPRIRPSPVGLASYERLRSRFAEVAEAGRLKKPVDDATAAYWASLHGVTSLVIAGSLDPRGAAAGIVREAIIDALTLPRGSRIRGARKVQPARRRPC